ncbi:Centrosomal spindle body, CEP44, putative [Trypanosoma equiperdum]|uniref:Centrosomal CEP44 domain-containing protein n=3 Tax=Trypanozoon TaxID=39700 RepID=Q57Y45_TRYB2|nr:hypothetical protein, conserved [Trypanosoma brucei gambiense DAL972]XP_846304.1 hypothetical protein, conserved [Trypanosoma brucei brucei TREU927]AAX69474.1 hypothetical protein, conserved [Trypanosoma brucei]SCU65420.1 Centrosomal spindle body, CEP44, putative [Trypanosoma equiperdum]AAZ12745.1 hypothetical protein, conserved [Trypanosoma brucei brucei TREU927]CBH12931.1 hypothetical protein, conserved [Trypanosoma brucei gambiense DAL972]|eukprot:XP_011775210.1 hypothetical protein, conserved [Trypanosoma brucei gambiense DAL972]
MEKLTLSALQHRLHIVGFDGWDGVSEVDVYRGDPHCYALFMRSILCGFPGVAALLMRRYPWFVIEGNDCSLASSVFRMLSQEYGYKPPITALQFRVAKYAAAKMRICIELFDLLKRSDVRENGGRVSSRSKVSRDIALPRHPHGTSEENVETLLVARLRSLDARRKSLNNLPRG